MPCILCMSWFKLQLNFSVALAIVLCTYPVTRCFMWVGRSWLICEGEEAEEGEEVAVVSVVDGV